MTADVKKTAPADAKRKMTVPEIMAAKAQGRKLTMVTTYDFAFANVVDRVDIDIILVGDSGAMVNLGYPNTLPVSMDEMLVMAKAVARGARNTFIIGDMPFLSYQVSQEKAMENAGRFLKEAGMDAIKLEGGRRVALTVKAMVEAGIPVMGHIGLTPQSFSQLGGFKVQAKSGAAVKELIDDALALQKAGVFAILLEAVPAEVGKIVTDVLDVPTVGIGAGPGTNGQVLILHDLLGLFGGFLPKFVKQYANLAADAGDALARYCSEVRGGQFPQPEQTYGIKPEQVEEILRELRRDGYIK
ncbi:MAG TPA: 3-methyl-2-oxobutanoate hydroxymethyltransferase [Bacillota bacterium]|jgi:3-methyl-2-oxobutanoate hydroxymethyltransferase